MIGVLLVNIGTPDSPRPKDVHRYLTQFLLDPRIITLPYLSRQLLVRGAIIPLRYKTSAKSYQKIWTPEGSPLLVHTKKLTQALQEEMGPHYHIVPAMRYGNPSIKSGLKELQKHKVEKIIVLPLFPQYASATSGSILEEVFSIVKEWNEIPNIETISSFYHHPLFIEAWVQVAKSYVFSDYDHVIFSYHGLPLSQISQNRGCLKDTCCAHICPQNRLCYKAQCIATTAKLVNRLPIGRTPYTISFQSRLGRQKWLEPYTSQVIKQRAKLGDKRILVISPSFVADCLETLFELEIEAREEFLELNGLALDLVPSLNSHPSWVQALTTIIKHPK